MLLAILAINQNFAKSAEQENGGINSRARGVPRSDTGSSPSFVSVCERGLGLCVDRRLMSVQPLE